MKLLENEALQEMVDYSFGDHSGVLGGVPNAYMKKANMANKEFVNKLIEVKQSSDTMTIFIDNIRLYRRPIEFSDWLHMKPVSDQDRQWLNQFEDEDLLNLCAHFPTMKFVIFTAFEDTPLDEHIKGRIPANVVSINAANAVVFGGKIQPFPHGIERKMYPGYDHHVILREMMNTHIAPDKLLFVAHRADTGNRASLGSLFKDKTWATVTHLPYEEYLTEMKRHKFVLCPPGNGIESARNWETLYMRRVPIFLRHPYLQSMFKGFPALFVSKFEDVTEEMLKRNDKMFEQAQTMSMDGLDLEKVFKSRI